MFASQWAAAKDRLVRVEVLQKHQRDLMLSGLVNRSDEAATATRRFKDLVGPSGYGSTMERARKDGKICWRDGPSEQRQATLTLEMLSGSLPALRKEVWSARSEARSRLEPHQYWARVRSIRSTTARTRSMEKCRLKKRLEQLRKDAGNCTYHILCRWMERFLEN